MATADIEPTTGGPAAPVEPSPPSSWTTASGIQIEALKRGAGDVHPGPRDRVTVSYAGWTADGREFDSSSDRGPSDVLLNRVIEGWTEVLQLMVVGDRWRVDIPAELAYGDESEHPLAPAGTLTFEIELIKIVAAPPAPPSVAAPPPEARPGTGGVAYLVLEAAPKGGPKPKRDDRVKVHYSGWSSDGNLFDSSLMRGSPATFPLRGVIQGWAETLVLMSPGDKWRVWIPADMAYGNKPSRPNAPAGMLVFEIELIEILPSPPVP